MKIIALLSILLVNFQVIADDEINIYEYDQNQDGFISSIEIETAINLVGEGAILFFPNGEYVFSNTILLESKAITLKGESESNTIFTYINNDSASYPRMFEVESDNFRIEKVTFDIKNKVLSQGDLIYIRNGSNGFLLDHVTIKNIHGTRTSQQYAVRMDGAGVNNYLITNSTFDNIKQNGGNDGDGGTGFVGAIYIYWGGEYDNVSNMPSNGTISDSLFQNIYTVGTDPDADAIRFAVKESDNSFNTIISNNTFIDVQKRAVKVGSVNGVSIIGNHVSSKRSDFCMRAAFETLSNSQNILISDNIADGKLKNGIVLAGESLIVMGFNFHSTCGTVENGIQIGATYEINADTVTIENINISNANRGIYAFYNSKNIIVSNVNVGNAKMFGLVIFPGSNTVTVSNLRVDSGPFAWIEGVYEDKVSVVKNINIYNSGNHFDPENINTTSLVINAAKNVKFSGCYVESNSFPALQIKQHESLAIRTEDISFYDCDFNRESFTSSYPPSIKAVVSIYSGDSQRVPINITFSASKIRSAELNSIHSSHSFNTLFLAIADNLTLNNLEIEYKSLEDEKLSHYLNIISNNYSINASKFHSLTQFNQDALLNGQVYEISTPAFSFYEYQ